VVATTRSNEAVVQPGRGVWTYRVGVAANYLNDESLGDVFLVSRAVTVAVHE
jgi:hypothetical protein